MGSRLGKKVPVNARRFSRATCALIKVLRNSNGPPPDELDKRITRLKLLNLGRHPDVRLLENTKGGPAEADASRRGGVELPCFSLRPLGEVEELHALAAHIERAPWRGEPRLLGPPAPHRYASDGS